MKTLILAVSILALASAAQAAETQRTEITSGTVVRGVDGSVATTTTNFGGERLIEELQGTGSAGGGAAAGAGSGGSAGATGGGCK